MKDAKPKKQLHNRRRFWLLLAFAAVVMYWLVMRSPLTRWVVVREIEKATGLEVRGGSVVLSPTGEFSLKSMTLAVPPSMAYQALSLPGNAAWPYLLL